MMDHDRWEDPASLRPEWDERTKLLAAEIPEGSNVVDFGAGSEALRDFLCTCGAYYPVDSIRRSSETIVVDLNEFHGTEEIPRNFAAVFSGSLEYIEDVPGLLVKVVDMGADLILTSYATLDVYPEWKFRDLQGWVNGLHEDSLLALLDDLGFEGKRFGTWEKQGLYRFERRAG